jgi:hypothetical protein
MSVDCQTGFGGWVDGCVRWWVGGWMGGWMGSRNLGQSLEIIYILGQINKFAVNMIIHSMIKSIFGQNLKTLQAKVSTDFLEVKSGI